MFLQSLHGPALELCGKLLQFWGQNTSDPKYIAVRSAKHSGSLTFYHLCDMNEITDSFQDKSSKEQKVMNITVDGGLDKNLRYTNTINCAIDCFNENDLDAYFVATNAPGQSAFNQVERRMSNLIKGLSGVILPHDHFGTHLDNNNNTVNEELKLRSFEHAGEILDKLWSKLVINDHPVVAEFVREEPSDITITKLEE